MVALLIKNGIVVNDDTMFQADVLIDDGVIVDVAPSIPREGNVEVLDASGRMVIPGGIDPHTHMQMPFMGEVAVDDFYTGTRAALAGGTTMIIDFVISTKECHPLDAYRQWREWADPKCGDLEMAPVQIRCRTLNHALHNCNIHDMPQVLDKQRCESDGAVA